MSILLPLLLALQSQPAEPLQAGTLKSIVGPLAPHYPDPASGIGSDRFSMRMRHSARQGNVPAVEVPAGTSVLADRINNMAGWKAYQLQVPGKASVKLRLRSDHEAWFRMTALNRWGRMEEGMLQNRIYHGVPEATYNNPKDTPGTVYFVVDTTSADPMSDPYTLEISWK